MFLKSIIYIIYNIQSDNAASGTLLIESIQFKKKISIKNNK